MTRATRTRAGLGATAIAVLSLASCNERSLAPAPACTQGDRGVPLLPWRVLTTLDLLLVIDDSGSMAHEAHALVEELPRLFEILSRGDLDGDGALEFVPFESIQAGVITTDLGAGPHTGVPTCAPGLGDDGILRSRRTGPAPGCFSTYPSGVFTFQRGADVPSELAGSLACVADSTGGCSFEQPLESALKALSPITAASWTAVGYEPARFLSADGDTDAVAGQADGPNYGFLRPNSVLAIVILTDEDDCSMQDYGLLADDPRVIDVPAELRCARFADATLGLERPIDRYVRGLAGLRRDPSNLVFAAIVGIPPAVESPDGDAEYAALLAHPDMQPRVAPDGETAEPSCLGPIVNAALPPVRLVQTARGLAALGAHVTLSSICEGTFAPAIDTLAAEIAETHPFGCLPRALPRSGDELIECEMFELMRDRFPACDESRGREHVDMFHDELGAYELCRVAQVPRSSTEPGWYYDDSDEAAESCGATPQRIAFVAGAGPLAGSETRFVCVDDVTGRDRGPDLDCDADNDARWPCRVGMFCDVTDDRCGTGHARLGGAPLTCDPVDQLCAVPCASDLDCRNAGEPDDRCDLRSSAALLGPDADRLPDALRDAPREVCVHPTCGP